MKTLAILLLLAPAAHAQCASGRHSQMSHVVISADQLVPGDSVEARWSGGCAGAAVYASGKWFPVPVYINSKPVGLPAALPPGERGVFLRLHRDGERYIISSGGLRWFRIRLEWPITLLYDAVVVPE